MFFIFALLFVWCSSLHSLYYLLVTDLNELNTDINIGQCFLSLLLIYRLSCNFYIFSGQEKAIAQSKYEEDVYINNHTVCQLNILFSLVSESFPSNPILSLFLLFEAVM